MDRAKITDILLAGTRIVLGYFMLWGFFDKMFGLGFETSAGQGVIDGGSPSSFVKYFASGPLADLWKSIAGTQIADFLLMAGLLLIGVTLVLGIAKNVTTVSFTIFLFCMYTLELPPSDNPLLDYHITWILLIWILYFTGGFEKYSLYNRYKEIGIVKKYKILQ